MLASSVVLLGPHQYFFDSVHVAVVIEDCGVVTWDVDTVDLLQKIYQSILIMFVTDGHDPRSACLQIFDM